MATTFLGDSLSGGGKAARISKILKGVGIDIGRKFKQAGAIAANPKMDTVLMSSMVALNIADVFKDDEDVNETEMDYIIDDVLDYGMAAVTILSFIPMFRLVSVPLKLLRSVIPVSQIAKLGTFRQMPFFSITNKRLFNRWKSIRPSIKGLTNARVTRDIKASIAYVSNQANEIILTLGKHGVTVSPKLAKALKTRGLTIAGGTVAGLAAIGLNGNYQSLSDEEKDEADTLLEEFVNMILTISGYVNDTDDLDYELDSEFSPYFGTASVFEIVSNYEWYKDRLIQRGTVRSTDEFDLLLSKFMVESVNPSS